MDSTKRHWNDVRWLVVLVAIALLLSEGPIWSQTPSPNPAPATSTPTGPLQNPTGTSVAVTANPANPTRGSSSASNANDKEPDWAKIVVGLAWPVAILILALSLASGIAYSPTLARLLGLSAKVIRKIKAGGVEMEISADAVDQIRAHFRASIDELVDNARTEYDRMADLRRIYEHLERAITVTLRDHLKTRSLKGSPAELRATVYVQDIVFREYLYQLVDYYPFPSGAGRRFSQRYGIIGRSWRLGQSLGEGDAVISGEHAVETLVREWGMLRQEAHAQSRARPSYLCIILRGKENDFPVGLLFVDATDKNAFGNDVESTALTKQMEAAEAIIALGSAVEMAIKPLEIAAPNIDIARLAR